MRAGGAGMNDWKAQQVLIVGGGIGGLAAALALSRKGIASQVIEQAAEFKEIGAGIQLGPNVFWMFEALGLIEPVSALAVFPNNLIMMDSVTGQEVTRIPLGDSFRKKFHHPYALIHRADLHKVLLQACQKSDLIRLDASQKVVKVDETGDGITVHNGGRRRPAETRRPYHLSRRAADVGNAGAISLARHGAVGR
jgi:2-polyprenyl-6-methoxyphenol hydroxylase-like FAD-dependent oxidoreductase